MRLLEGALELLAPTRCAGCDRPGTLLCEACERGIVRIDGERACRRCGAPDGRSRCEECRDRHFAFHGARCAGVLAHPLSRLVVLYKDGGERRLAEVLGTMIADACGEWSGWPDAVVPIAASRRARLRRGFDHGALLGAAVARRLDAPMLPALVSVARGDQRRLGREERARNVGSRLAVTAGVELPARILLVDDVLTTGATLDAAAAALLAAGACEVRAATIARACEW